MVGVVLTGETVAGGPMLDESLFDAAVVLVANVFVGAVRGRRWFVTVGVAVCIG